MEKTNDANVTQPLNSPKKLDSPEKIAQWMRDADYAFDFRGANHWSLTGGLRTMSDDANFFSELD